MTAISLVLFDLNGVLYRYDRAARIAALSAVSGQPAAAIKGAIWDSGFEDAGDSGTLSADAYLHGFGACIGYALTEAEWVAALRASVTPIAETLALLPRLRSGVRCAVLTNNNLLVRRHFAAIYPEVAQRAGAAAYVSAEFGLRKPDPAVYACCLSACGGEPPGTVFIDDSPANVAGARTAGLAGCDYLGVDALTAALAGYGVLD